jgi:hypothetical protein
MTLSYRRGRGHIPNAAHRRPRSILNHPMLGAPLRAGEALSLPLVVDLTPHAPPVPDQGQSGSCEAHAESGAVHVTLSAAGAPLGFVPSQDTIYKIARAIMRTAYGDTSSTPLSDSGLEPIFATQAAADWGVMEKIVSRTSDGRFDDVEDDPKLLNAEPQFSNILKSARKLVRGAHWIDLFGSTRYAAMQAALATGRALKIAIYADSSAFQQYDGTTVLSATRSPGSDHAAFLLGYRHDDHQRRIWKGMNSWGEAWGIAGLFECDDSLVDFMTDIEVVDAQNAIGATP